MNGIIIVVIISVVVLVSIFLLVGFLLIAPIGKGDDGPQGNKGLEGDQGPDGKEGFQGPRGTVVGAKGALGPQGVTGPKGTQGIQGDTGLTGFTGNTGETGLNFISTLHLSSDAVISLTPGFTGSTGGFGSSQVLSTLQTDYNLYNYFNVAEDTGTKISLTDPGAMVGKYKVNFEFSSLSETNAVSNQLRFYIEDETTAVLDSATLTIPPNYLDQEKTYTVPLFIDATGKTYVKMFVENETFVNVGIENPDETEYELHINRVSVLFQGASGFV